MGLLGFVSLINWLGLVGPMVLVHLVNMLGLLFYLIEKYFQMKILSLMFQSNSMIPKSSMIQKEFQLGVWTLIIQKSMVIPPSWMVLFNTFKIGSLCNLILPQI